MIADFKDDNALCFPINWNPNHQRDLQRTPYINLTVPSEQWLSYNHSECTWFHDRSAGPACSSGTQTIVSINLPSNNLDGTIPPEISLLTNIEFLGLHRNPIMGTLTSHIGKLSKLQQLIVRENQMTGLLPSEIARLSDLEHFAILRNQFAITCSNSL